MKNLILLFALLSTSVFAWPDFLPAIGLNKMISKEVPHILITRDQQSVAEIKFLKSGRGFYKADAGTAEFRWNKTTNLITMSNFSNGMPVDSFYYFENNGHQTQVSVTIEVKKIELYVHQLQLKARYTSTRTPTEFHTAEEIEDFLNNPSFEKEFSKEVIIDQANPKFINNNTKFNGNKNVMIKLNPLTPATMSTLSMDASTGSIVYTGSTGNIRGLNQGSTLEYTTNAKGFEMKMDNGDVYNVSYLNSDFPNLLSKVLVRLTTADNEFVYLSDMAQLNRPYTLMPQDVIGSYFWRYDETDSTEYKYYNNFTGEIVWEDETQGRMSLPYSWELDNNTLIMTRFYSESGMPETVHEVKDCVDGVSECVPFQKRELELVGESNGYMLFVRYFQMNNKAFDYIYTGEEFDPNWKVDRNSADTSLFIYTKY